jgi:excisionase family DNA binding protein
MARDAPPLPKLLTTAEVAAALSTTPGTVRRWIRSGEMRAVRVGEAYNGPLRVPAFEVLARMHLARPEEPEREVVER